MKNPAPGSSTVECSFRRAWLLVALSLLLSIAEAGSDRQPGAFEPEFDDAPRAREVEEPAWFETSFLDLREDLEMATGAHRKRGLVVYFHQEDCAYCQALIETNFGSEDISRYTQRYFDVVSIDIWGSREVVDPQGLVLTERDYAVREQTNFTPSLIFYDADGNQALRLRGYYPPYRFRAALEYVAGGHYRQESFPEYLARADPPPKFELGDLNEQDFFDPPPFVLDRSRQPAQRPLVVFFEQRDCHACDILHTRAVADPQTLALLDRFEAVQLDLHAETPVITPSGGRTSAADRAAELGLFYAPTLVFFNERGDEIMRIDSVVRLYRLRRVLRFVLEKGYLEDATYQLWRRRQRNR
jgi:thioredoxin-related protein